MEKPFPAYRGSEPYIFVSYSHEDSGTVYPEIRWLKEQGFNIWYDEGISPGHEWRDELGERIAQASLFLYFVTPQAVLSEHCVREVSYAIDQKRRLLVVYLEPVTLPHGLGMSLSAVQAILRFELSDLDYRVKLLTGAGNHIARGIAEMTIAETPPKPQSEGTARKPLRKFLLELPINPNCLQPLAITPDGNHILFSGMDGDKEQIFTRPLSELVNLAVPGTEGTLVPFALSPDGTALVFRQLDPLHFKRISRSGGIGATLLQAVGGDFSGGFVWGPNDAILFRRPTHGGLMQVSAHGGTPIQLTTPADGMQHVHPFVLPGGDGVLMAMAEQGHPHSGHVALFTPSTGETRVLIEGVSPRLTTSDHLLFTRENTVWAVGFDRARGELAGTAAPVLSEVNVSSQSGVTQYAVSEEGTLVYLPRTTDGTSELAFVDRDSQEEVVGTQPMDYRAARVSPDGRRIAVEIREGARTDIWTYSRRSNNLMRLTIGANSSGPVWTPDSERVVFSMRDGDASNLFSKAANGTGAVERLTTSTHNPVAWSSSAPANAVFFFENINGKEAIGMVSLHGDHEVTTLIESEFNCRRPVLSLDGHWMAYESDESGRMEIYVTPFPDVAGARWQVSRGGGVAPMWSSDGFEIYYLVGPPPFQMMVAPIETEHDFETGMSRPVFDLGEIRMQALGGRGFTYDVSRDDGRFLMIKPVSIRDVPAVVLVENWFDELERLVPTK